MLVKPHQGIEELLYEEVEKKIGKLYMILNLKQCH